MKKRIFMALLAAVSSFAMVSCGDDDKNDDPKPGVSTKASFGQESNSVWVVVPLDEEDLKDMPEGSASQKSVWKWNSNNEVTEFTATVTCDNKELAQALYNQALADKDNPEEVEMGKIDRVTINGCTVTAIYEIPEGYSKMDAVVEAKMFAILCDIKGVEYTPEEEAYMKEQMGGFDFDDDTWGDDDM